MNPFINKIPQKDLMTKDALEACLRNVFKKYGDTVVWEIINTIRPCVALQMNKSDLSQDSFVISKLGGTPFCDDTYRYPHTLQWEPMLFVWQINTQQIPYPDQLLTLWFPKSGILQFFIEKADDYMAEEMCIRLIQADYEWLFSKAIKQHESEWFQDMPFSWNPVLFKIKPYLVYEIAPLEYIEEHLEQISEEDGFSDEYTDFYQAMQEVYSNAERGWISKVWWYPDYTQSSKDSVDNKIQLLQLVSENHDFIRWDAGIAHFFVDPEDLKKMDFSEAEFYRDCY